MVKLLKKEDGLILTGLGDVGDGGKSVSLTGGRRQTLEGDPDTVGLGLSLSSGV